MLKQHLNLHNMPPRKHKAKESTTNGTNCEYDSFPVLIYKKWCKE
jgi:hypothetical protein